MLSGLTFSNEGRKNQCVNELVQHRVDILKEQSEFMEQIDVCARLENVKLESDIMNISYLLVLMRKKLAKYKHDTFVNAIAKCNDEKDIFKYPSQNVVIQNLIRSQIEFYFSDYYLKREKKLLDKMCQKNNSMGKIGFLSLHDVKNLPRVRPLCRNAVEIIQALKHSTCLIISHDNQWIGRNGFKMPKKEITSPYRHGVFVYGLPLDCDEGYVYQMLEPFGQVNKIVFDDGDHSIDRLVSQVLFKESDDQVVYTLKQGMTTFEHRFNNNNNKETCVGLNLTNDEMKERYIGKPKRNNRQESKTCVAVFSSQRQASKCVYVGSRIAHQDCFWTHYHRYSEIKKSILLKMKCIIEKPHQFGHYTRNQLKSLIEDLVFSQKIVN